MRRVVMIAYAFPPEGGAGAHRPLRFVRHLPARGWYPIVVSADKHHYVRYDPGLLASVPSEAEIIRVRGCDLWQAIQARRAQRIEEWLSTASVERAARIHEKHHTLIRSFLRGVVRIAEAWWYHPDMAASWIQPAMEATVKMCIHKWANVIWATGGPWSSFVVAQRVSQRRGVPYVLDFRDPWTLTLSEFEVRRPTWAQHRDQRTLYKLLKGAQAVIFRSETEAECYWCAYRVALDVSRIHIIPNGYE